MCCSASRREARGDGGPWTASMWPRSVDVGGRWRRHSLLGDWSCCTAAPLAERSRPRGTIAPELALAVLEQAADAFGGCARSGAGTPGRQARESVSSVRTADEAVHVKLLDFRSGPLSAGAQELTLKVGGHALSTCRRNRPPRRGEIGEASDVLFVGTGCVHAVGWSSLLRC